MWYLDDGTLIGTPEQIQAALQDLSSGLAAVGLSINRSKSVLWSPDPEVVMQGALAAFAITPVGDGVVVLGTPIGSDAFVKTHLSSVLRALKESWERLLSLGNTQAASQILRTCLGPAKVVHLLRSLLPRAALWFASELSPRMRELWEAVIGQPLDDGQWSLAVLPIREGDWE